MKQIILILGTLMMISCGTNSSKEKELLEREKAVLEKENELLKKEIAIQNGRKDIEETDKPLNKPQEITPEFHLTKSIVKSRFMAYLPTISGGRKLNSAHQSMDNGIIIKLGDLDNDGQIDAVVDYSLVPTWDDNGGGGNALGEISGLVVYRNTGRDIQFLLHSDTQGHGDLQSISNGVIRQKTLKHGPNDARCCPSVEGQKTLKLSGNKLVAI